MRKLVLGMGVALVQFALASSVLSEEARNPPLRIKAPEVSLYDLARADGKLVAVGERGVILQSKDDGRSWVGTFGPTDRALLAVAFVNERTGVAVGHGGTILRTDDGGTTWQSIAIADAGRDAILGATALSDGRVLAYGAFGMYLESADAGKTWRRRQIVSDDFDRHISKIIEVDKENLLLVAESGTIALSDNHGESWRLIKSPYEGSYFGALKLHDGALLIYGMRGNVFRSSDNGHNWASVPFNSKSTLNGGSVAPDGRVVLAGNGGLIATSSDDGRSFKLTTTVEARPLAQARFAGGAIVYVGNLSNDRIEAVEK